MKKHTFKFTLVALMCICLSSQSWARAISKTATTTSAATTSATVEAPKEKEKTMNIVPVGEAVLDKEKLLFVQLPPKGTLQEKQHESANSFIGILENDFAFYRHLFLVTDAKNYQNASAQAGSLPSSTADLIATSSPAYSYWQENKIDYLVTIVTAPDAGPAAGKGKGASSVHSTIIAYDIRKGSIIHKEDISYAAESTRSSAHQVASNIFFKMKGREAIFKSKIFFVSDRSSDYSRRVIIKEIYVMDFDGQNITKLTNHRGIVISPAISKNNQYLLYSLIKEERGKKRNVELYRFDLQSRKQTLISSLEGINSGAVFFTDENYVALTLTHKGNAEIHMLNLKTKDLRPLTNHPSVDVDPFFAPDGKSMVFVSGRHGNAAIFMLDPSGKEKEVRRLSYVGEIHGTPRISPSNKEIVFSSWIDGSFSIYRIDVTGNEIHRLTKNFGSNENPYFSNDGEFIVFSSKRVLSKYSSVNNLYIMTRDGEIFGAITGDLGNCTSPVWSN
ncbi:MAG: PD40 domain-containing protein [Oligoflexia bacterium]|nr:PD40 domain-containing protein [Oligoflexia bacterium]